MWKPLFLKDWSMKKGISHQFFAYLLPHRRRSSEAKAKTGAAKRRVAKKVHPFVSKQRAGGKRQEKA